MNLRPYQQEAVDCIFREFADHQSTLLVLPTGTGKTVVFSTVAHVWETGRVIIMAHREELIRQAAEKIHAITGDRVDIEMGEYRAPEGPDWLVPKAKVLVTSVQTMSRPGRLAKFDPKEFGLLITDEAHHSTAQTYRRVYEYYQQNPNLKHLGVTATPDRGDSEALGQIFDTVAFEYAIPDAINDGWLVPIEQRYVKIEGLDFSKARTTAGDLNAGDLEQIMIAEKPLHGVADAVVKVCENRQVIIFTVTVAHAERLAEILCRHRESSAICLHGETETEERRRQLRRFKDRAYQYLVNCGLFLEGFDEPGIAAVAVARPTKSRSLYAQMIGRGTRPLPGLVDGIDDVARRVQTIGASLKPQLLVIDFVGNSGRHKLISTADILGGEYTLEALDAAKAEAESGGVNFLTRPKEIQAELDAEEERRKEEARIRKEEQRRRQQEAEIERRKKIVASATFSQQVVNPFDVYDLPPKREPPWLKGKPPTDKQKAYLEGRGIPTEGLTFCRASQLIDAEITRRDAGKCSYKQARLLQRFGYSADLSFSEAKTIIDQLAKNGWKRPETVGVAA